MSVAINPGEVRLGLERQNQLLRSMKERIQPLCAVVRSNTANNQSPKIVEIGLNSGSVHDSQQPMLYSLESGLDSLIEANKKHIETINSSLEDTDYDQAQILSEIKRLDTLIDAWESNPITPHIANILSRLHIKRKKVSEKYIELQNYILATSNMRDTVDNIWESVERNLIRVEYRTICSVTGNVVLPASAKIDEVMSIKKLLSELTQFENDGHLKDESWEMVREILGRRTDRIEDFEFALAAKVFVSLKRTSDTERFLNSLAVHVGTGKDNCAADDGENESSYNIFSLCIKKICKLLQKIDAAVWTISEVQRNFKPESTPFEIFERLRCTLLERYVLLSTITEQLKPDSLGSEHGASEYYNVISSKSSTPIMFVESKKNKFDLAYRKAKIVRSENINEDEIAIIDAMLEDSENCQNTISTIISSIEKAEELEGATKAKVQHKVISKQSNIEATGILNLGSLMEIKGVSNFTTVALDIFGFIAGAGEDDIKFGENVHNHFDITESSWYTNYFTEHSSDVVVVRNKEEVHAHVFPKRVKELSVA